MGLLGEWCVEEEAPHRPESYQGDTEPQSQEEAPLQKTSNFVPH